MHEYSRWMASNLQFLPLLHSLLDLLLSAEREREREGEHIKVHRWGGEKGEKPATPELNHFRGFQPSGYRGQATGSDEAIGERETEKWK